MASISEVRAVLEDRQKELRDELGKVEGAIRALSDGVVDEVRSRTGSRKPARRRASAGRRASAAVANGSTKNADTRDKSSSIRSRSDRGGGRPKRTREERLLAAVQRSPGITVPQAAKKMKVAASGLYPVRSSLVESGKVRIEGKGLHPVGK